MARLKERPDVEFFASLAAIARLYDQRLESASPPELSSAGLGVLGQLAQWPGAPAPQDLARALRLSKSALTSSLQRLERAGYVAVAGDPADGRRKRVSITESGLAVLRDAVIALRPEQVALRAHFETAEFEAALPLLRRLLRWLEPAAAAPSL